MPLNLLERPFGTGIHFLHLLVAEILHRQTGQPKEICLEILHVTFRSLWISSIRLLSPDLNLDLDLDLDLNLDPTLEFLAAAVS
mmetsp:Transcript_6622/g.12935  ORF Transcript_6622/g.12935 Transcript_6622/m.12935 type:complete len:84 (+) Transcript_6622:1394-1645(+)